MTAGFATRVRVKVEGTVQGVGFRPYVYRAAHELGLSGWIMNAADGVMIEAEGTAEAIDRLLERIQTGCPPGARIDRISDVAIPPMGSSVFTIKASCEEGTKQLPIAADLATCADCVAELFDQADRRFRYPWLSCAQCGPRFSMVTGVPYDRAQTTLSRFMLCQACREEYDKPADRRFHAESTACPQCGPQLSFWRHQGQASAYGEVALGQACEMIRTGAILAVKGIGGFHLWVDATSEAAVQRLRDRKRRPHKPFAVMFPSLGAIRENCEVAPGEVGWLISPQAPIVILPRMDRSILAQAVAPGNSTVGAMLPYAPLHHLLMRELEVPVVATSGNRSEEPLVTDEREALQRLGDLADAYLIHDRPIARPVDDSVVRWAKSGPIVIRRARGLVPRAIRLPEGITTARPVLAVGGHLKNTVALLEANRVLLSQHLGDLSTVETERAVQQAIDDLQWLLRVKPRVVACDLHPDYRSTNLAEELSRDWDVPLIRVQHHHAHVASCMTEHGVTGEVLGVAWDGAGYGTDGSLWGGEFLVATYWGYRRAVALRPFRLPGGEQAVREPWRTALAVRWETFGLQGCCVESGAASGRSALREQIVAMLEKQLHSPMTTSVGRLFDAVASMLDLSHVASFEGQAAMALEQEGMSGSAWGDGEVYPILLTAQDVGQQQSVADWRPMIQRIALDLRAGIERSRIAYRFHRSLAELIGQVAELVGLEQVVLTGGCFQNVLLADLARERLESAGFSVLIHRQVPPNDGGLSLGQAVIAAMQAELKQQSPLCTYNG